jgi:polysaccharide export outer membrane protein
MQPARLGARTLCFAWVTLCANLALAPSNPAQTVLETAQQTNDRIRSRSMVISKIEPHDYIIGSGDVLAIQVFDIPELSGDVRVSQTGSIGVPLVPVRLHVTGLTETQAQQKIAEVLEANGLVSHPQVTVSLKERKSKPITVVGAVAHPMVYQADGPVTLVEVLAQAGGIANDAADTVIVTRPESDGSVDSLEPPPIGLEDVIPISAAETVSHEAVADTASPGNPAPDGATPRTAPSDPAGNANGSLKPEATSPSDAHAFKNTITVNLNELLEAGDSRNNIALQAGDIVTVPHAGIVYVLGAVTRPGGFVVSNDRSQLTTLKVLALAGGMTHTAKTSQAVVIRKDNQGRQHEVAVDLGKVVKREAEDLQLQPSDVLYIPENAVKQAMVRAAEVGLAIGSAVAIFRIANH